MNETDSVRTGGPLKLFVLGESSGDPVDWSGWGRRAFVLATSKDEALSLHDGYSDAAEVIAVEPCVLGRDDPGEPE